ncbi:hypothetical protein HELRODRAFT_174808 [Helobdella robusta]|uniref:CHCH domain-containing protein n=1 Tax=Helobdella robusta TaxID=6412 RepID=T1F8I1_HELRO|nr:hypothetical protein HELRODRAFT_174808 [Helobdella robusta]ESO01261.1 hypothetical protein HELRODRAFT_174808 [Helobdella robusta]
MGNSETREITIENDKDTISQSLSKKLMSEDEFQQLKSLYDQKIATLQNKNARLYGATVSNFARGVERLEEKYLKALRPPVCGEQQLKIVECYKESKNKTLNCGHSVDEFNACLQQYRQSRTVTSG